MKTNFFGNLFDFNDDGEVDEIESVVGILYLEMVSDDTDNEDNINSDVNYDSWGELTYDIDSGEDSDE